MEVPHPAVNTELQLCISFESNSSSDWIVVLAHHTEDPTKLSAYSSCGNQAFQILSYLVLFRDQLTKL